MLNIQIILLLCVSFSKIKLQCLTKAQKKSSVHCRGLKQAFFANLHGQCSKIFRISKHSKISNHIKSKICPTNRHLLNLSFGDLSMGKLYYTFHSVLYHSQQCLCLKAVMRLKSLKTTRHNLLYYQISQKQFQKITSFIPDETFDRQLNRRKQAEGCLHRCRDW